MAKSVYSGRYKRFRELLMEQRLQAKLTQEAVAEKLGKPQSYVSKYEAGERRLDVVEFLAIAEAIGFDPAQLVKQVVTSRT